MAEEIENAAETEEKPQESGKKKKIMIMGGAGALLVIIGVVAFLFLGKGGEDAEGADGAEGESTAATEESPADETKQPVFMTLGTPFTVNFQINGDVHFLQVGIDVMAREQTVLDQLLSNMPIVQHKVNMVLSRADDTIYTAEGKEAMNAELLREIRSVLKSEYNNVEAVFFTSLVIQ